MDVKSLVQPADANRAPPVPGQIRDQQFALFHRCCPRLSERGREAQRGGDSPRLLGEMLGSESGQPDSQTCTFKSLQTVTAAMELKAACSLKEKL